MNGYFADIEILKEEMLKYGFRSPDQTVTEFVEETLPVVEIREKYGEWMTSYLNHESMGVRPKILYCSECCQCMAYPTNFCPNCGADMRRKVKK